MRRVEVRKSPDTIRAEAAAWISKLHGPQRSPELEAGLRRWLAEDERHSATFERMTQAWEDATTIVARTRFARLRVAQGGRVAASSRAAAILAVIALGAFGTYAWLARSTYTTGIGEQRTIRLDDGTRVSVNSASRVVVRYDERERHIRLERGEAFFEVASEARRPFIVLAGERAVKALGTSFVVRYDAGRLAVTLVDGKVSISTPTSQSRLSVPGGSAQNPPDPEAPVRLAPGQRFTVAANNVVELDTPGIDAVTAWRRGEVVLDKTVLADAIADMNRYDGNRLVIDDPAIAALRVSGVYRSGDNANFARVVARMYGLTVAQEGNVIRIYR